MKTLAILSRKGGTGKSTLAVHLAVAAEEAGETTALIDLDPQGSAIRWSDARSKDSPVVISAHSTRLGHVLHTAQQNGATLAIIDTSPHAEPAALDAAKAANFALVPCRPSIFDLQAVKLTFQIADMAQVKTHIVFNAVPSRGDRVDQAREAVGIYDVPCAPCVIGNRIAFSDAVLEGKTVQEYDPSSKASHEVRALYKYVSKEMGV